MIVRKFCASSILHFITRTETSFGRTLSTMPQKSPILVSTLGKIRLIEFNRPEKKNAISSQMYLDIAQAVEDASKDENIMMLVLTGKGPTFSSGTDLQPNLMEGDISAFVEQANKTLLHYVNAFINFPKLLVAIVNGPALGISCTILGLFDVVYASEKATFNTPFAAIGFTAEGCSSYTFPRIMGTSKAGEMLYLNRRLSAVEAKECGLVADVYKDNELDSVIWPRLKKVAAEFSKDSIINTKELVRRWDKDILLETNKAEVEALGKRWASEDVFNSLIKFMNRKEKSKL